MNLLGDRICYYCGIAKATTITAQDAPICSYCDGFAKRSRVKNCRHRRIEGVGSIARCAECGYHL